MSTKISSLVHWDRTTDANGICWLTLDKAGSATNTLDRQVLAELDTVLQELAVQPPRGLIIRSAKSTGFIAGADIREFDQLENAEQGASAARNGQIVLQRLEDLSSVSVAVIDGYALGGGLELALACDYRVAVESYERSLGLPEVQLGIQPGFGGTVRAVQLLGSPLALDLMLSGRLLSSVQARKVGLVDRTAARIDLDSAARSLIETHPPKRRPPLHIRVLGLAPLRPLLARSVRGRLRKRANPTHYPAPYAILDLWLRHGGRGPAAYVAEAESIGRLLVTATCKNLVRVFFLRERLRSLAPKAAAVERVHVIGAGIMGGDIAAWCALRGLIVSVQDRAMEYVEPALKRAEKLFGRRLRAPGQALEARERLEVDLDGEHVGEAEVVIEAIVEKLEAKRALFEDLEARAAPDAILATNTSSIRLEEIAAEMRRPERLLGLHFFNPVAKLPLVEVIRGEQTDPAVFERAMSFVTQIGKLPLPCRSAPGFVVNRILAPYMLEALQAHEDGYALETIDAAAEEFGMPTGPVELIDRVGIDIGLHVIGVLRETLGVQAPERLERMVEAGELGAKTGQGFYKFKKNRPIKASDFPAPDADLRDRLILAMVNEAMACLEEEIVDDRDLLDAGVIFGTGFAPFRGGPIRYALDCGIEEIVSRLEALVERHGPRFTPRPGWRRLATDT
ncbi:MAG: 3-hydroxyacyl-CoA dehydrogenase NAD-binding domain-containing protein [Gammaproteobacteria bacterium]|nr:3-hydroxyacyl-CoA dehydrogenase NAD-binding domain-containing protein [Gammaproteobacteria bacterium]